MQIVSIITKRLPNWHWNQIAITSPAVKLKLYQYTRQIIVGLIVLPVIFASIFIYNVATTKADDIALRPNGDGTLSAGWQTSTAATTSLYAEVDDDPDTPNDSDYIRSANLTDNGMYLQLSDLPVNFESATSVEIKARHREAGTGNDTTTIFYRIVQSNESTAITSEVSTALTNNGSFVTTTYNPTITGTNTKTAWDGARLSMRTVRSQAQGPDDTPVHISAVEVTITYSPLATMEQSTYRFFANNDSTDVGSPLTTQDTTATLSSAGQAFRLRTAIHVSAANIATSGKTFKLQYAGKGGGSCQVPSGIPATYTDVTTATSIAYNDNTTPANGSALTDNINDPTHGTDANVNQTYVEANTFTNSQAAMNIGQDGLWDFSLKDNGATPGDTFCFRIVESSGTPLFGYTTYPEITTTPPTVTQRNYRFELDDGVDVNSNSVHGAANTTLTGVRIGERLITRLQLDVTGSSNLSASSFELYYDKNDDNFTPVTVGAEIQPATGLSGKTGDALTSAQTGTCTSGATFTNGVWHENTAVSQPTALNVGQCTELAFAIDTSNANPSTTYRLRLHNKTKGSSALSSYAQSPTLTTVSAGNDQIRASKDSVTKLPNCSHTDWGCEIIDSSVDAGSLWSSLTIDHNGDPWVSYYDATNTDLKVAQYVGTGGNCTSTKWDCFRVDIDAGTTGSNTSIGTDPFGHIWISYRHNSHDLKVAVNYDHPQFPACSAAGWDCIVVENTASDLAYESSISFDASGAPWVSYNDTGTNAIRLAWLVGTGGNCTSSAWNCGELDALGTAGLDGDWSSISFDSQGYAWVSYTDYTNTALKVATTHPDSFTGATTCTMSGWTCGLVDNTGTTTGEATSLGINPITDKPWIAYENEGGSALRYAKFVGTGGNCTSASWSCEDVDNGLAVVPDPSVDFDPAGNAWIAYFNDTSGTNREYKVARYVGDGTGTGCSSTAWQCTSVDTQTASTGEYGHDKAFKFDANGTAWGAYRDNTNSALKVAKTHLPHYYNPLKYPLDDEEYTDVEVDDASLDQVGAGAHTPMYNFTTIHSTNTDTIEPTWMGQSTVAASTDSVFLQIYRGGSTDAWQTMSTEISCTANNSCTITPSPISTNLSDYYHQDGSNYHLYFRVYQAAGTSKTLQTNYFTLASLSGGGPEPTPEPTPPPIEKMLRGGKSIIDGIKLPFFTNK